RRTVQARSYEAVQPGLSWSTMATTALRVAKSNGLSTQASAPSSRASRARVGSTPLTMTTRAVGAIERIRLSISMPFIPGSAMSSNTRSGRDWMKSSRPSSLVTALETSYPSSASMVTRMSTTARLSSITRILTVGTYITVVTDRGYDSTLLTRSSRVTMGGLELDRAPT